MKQSDILLELWSPKPSPLKESAILTAFVAGGIASVVFYRWVESLFSKGCNKHDAKSSKYAYCMSNFYDDLAVEYETRAKTDCSHFDSQESCRRKMDEVVDHFSAMAAKWRRLAKTRQDEEEEAARQQQE